MLILLSEFPSLSILSLMRPMLYFYIYGYACLNIEIRHLNYADNIKV